MKFLLSDAPIAVESMAHDAAGGFVVFEGKVRNHAEGRSVVGLEYEAFPEMALAQGEALVQEAIERFGLLEARVIHRVGQLAIGDTAVVVQTASAHRREAFEACEWLMDQLKWRVPIWKRETYASGVAEWVVPGEAAPGPVGDEMFTRQMRLPEVGVEGQTALAGAKVLLVGVGGLAAGSMPSLVGSGIGTLGLVDADLVELSNLHRQTLFAASDIGRLKVERAAVFARRLRPDLTVHTYPVHFSEKNAEQLVSAYDWVVDGTDSLSTKLLLDRVCHRLRRPLVTASVHQFEGQLMTVQPWGPRFTDLFPEPPPDHCVGTCAQSGVLGVVPSLMGVLQANEVIKGILGLPVLDDKLLLVDFRTLEATTIWRTSSGEQSFGGSSWDIDVASVNLDHFDLVDIREPDETPKLIRPHRRVPVANCYEGEWTRPTIFVCASGRRSYRLVADLRARGLRDVFSLQGGVECLERD
ncbi:MAG: ThiF family adenylyltransferase [Chthonomonas sp.]|nr:ThiF family adenylyltransferase [Chthonomonas sp.]